MRSPRFWKSRDRRWPHAVALLLLALLLVAGGGRPAGARAASVAPPVCDAETAATVPIEQRNCLTPAHPMTGAPPGQTDERLAPRHHAVGLTVGSDGIARGSVVVPLPPLSSGAPCANPFDGSPWSWPCVASSALVGQLHRYVPGASRAAQPTPTSPGTAPDGQPALRLFGGRVLTRVQQPHWRITDGLQVWIAWPAAELDRDTYLIVDTETSVARAQSDSGTATSRAEQVIRLPKQSVGTPTARCRATPVPGSPGEFRFASTSTDPSGTEPLATWTFPDDGQTRTGPIALHRFTTTGVHEVRLEVQGTERSARTTCSVTVQGPQLSARILMRDHEPPFGEDEAIRARVRVSASGDTIGEVDGITFTGGGVVRASGSGVAFGATAPDPPLPEGGFTLRAGEHRDVDVTLQPTGVGTYALSTGVQGRTPHRDASGAPTTLERTASATAKGEVGQALEVQIDLDPPEVPEQEEDADGPEEVDVAVTVRVTNRSGAAMHGVRLLALDAAPRVPTAEQTQFATKLRKVGGAAIDPDDGLPLGDGNVPDGATREYHAVYRASDDVEATFSALARGTRADGVDDLGAGRRNWSVKPKYLLGVTTRVVSPAAGTPIPAGQAIRITGEVENLSRTERLRVGPLFPELGGNAGATSFAWGSGGEDDDPDGFSTDGPLELAAGEKRTFTVRIVTAYSDPTDSDQQPRTNSGGVRADVRFTPWAKAIDEDGVERDVDVDRELRAVPGQLQLAIPVDDSIEIPQISGAAYAGGILYGGAQGVRNATASLLLAPADGLILFGSTLKATWEFQYQMWNSFTEAEKDAFVDDVASLAAEILRRNARYAAETPARLYQLASQAAEKQMTDLEVAWEVGDWTQATEVYSRAGVDAITQVVMPLAVAKMARSTTAVRAIARAQEALQTTFEATIGVRLSTVRQIEELAPLLHDIESGTELLPDQLSTLYGITPDELTELQRLADKYRFLLTVRSRHASSIRWIEEHGAMLKPEALKIKSVSELDARLGYREADVGSLVFRKPEPLQRYEELLATNPGTNLDAIIDGYVDAKRLPGESDVWVASARSRIELRIEEWKEWEKRYKQWGKLGDPAHPGQGFIDVSYNYKGNAIDDTVRKGTGKYVGFRLQPIAGDSEAFVVQMFDAKRGRWAPVTGDIDPIAFTHLDGSPLGMAEHADLLDDLSKSPALRGQHPESATFVGKKPDHDGVNFVAKQFKKQADGLFEAALQIAPDGLLPRVVRLNPDKSLWRSPFDYNLHWDGGFVHAGSPRPRPATPVPAPDWPAVGAKPYVAAPAGTVRPLPKSVDGEPNVGRCVVRYSNAPAAQPLVFDADYLIARIKDVAQGGIKSLVETGLESQCLAPGPPITLDVRPSTGVLEGAAAGATRIEVDETPTDAGRGPQAFEPGQRILVGAGTDHAEEAVIVGYGSLVLRDPLRHDHRPGETILVLESAPERPGEGGPGGAGDPGGPGGGGAAPGGPGTAGPGGPGPLGPIRSVAPPRISGAALVGRTVRVAGASWDPAPTATTYRWLADGRPVPGAAGASLRLPAALAGRRLAASLTARADGRGTATRDSATVVVKHGATVALALPRGGVRRGRRAGVRITVRTAATRRPAGTVVVRVDRRRVRARLRPAGRGRVTVRLPALRRGRHAITATYSGDRRIAAATTRRTTLRVR